MTKRIGLKTFIDFLRSASGGGILLLFCVVVSLAIANSPFVRAFNHLLSTEFGVNTTNITLRYPLLTWINDGLMAIFFLLVGLEIKREIISGELSSMKKAILPVLAAVGGVIAPALIYAAFNNANPQTANGWGIPMATDIAFALAILSLLGNRIPSGLKIFLAALAIVDDLMAILVIAIFYSSGIHVSYLCYALGIFAMLLVFNKLGIKNLVFYIIPGVVMWYCIHHSGIHATIAGVLTAFAIPVSGSGKVSPLDRLEHILSRPVNFVIMPLFALANTNITFESGMVQGLTGTLGLGVVFGLFIGKPLGIFTMSWLSVKLKLARLPERTTWLHMAGLGLLGGIGFTMSIFIALLSFNNVEYQNEAKFAVLVASVMSGFTGFVLLNSYSKRQLKKQKTDYNS